jgi:hypothetical protein
MLVRKKAVVVEAHQFKVPQLEPVPEWYQEAVREGVLEVVPDGDFNDLIVRTLEDGRDGLARHVASEGDYIIRGVQGELYPCKPDIFWQTYEMADAEDKWAKADKWLGRITPWVHVISLTLAVIFLLVVGTVAVFS